MRALLFQGPVGPFFSRLQAALDGAGWETLRILFNLGDELYHKGEKELAYFGDVSRLPQWLDNIFENFQPDVILLFGDQREIHRAAIEAANKAGIPAVCFEEGYLRPDYITMELDGNNACSQLRRFRAEDAVKQFVAPKKIPGNGFHPTARYAALYFTAMRAGLMRFPYYQHHRSRGTIRESMMWMRNAQRKWRHQKRNLRDIHWIIEAIDANYFLVALQVHDDLQLVRHGGGWSLDRVIAATIGSFARSAHPNHHLVFKGHPLDRGHSSSRELTFKVARTFNVVDRVHYVDDGSLGLLSRHCRGMVTVNSTSAMVAFGHGKPVFACGESFYECLTANGSDRNEEALSKFWRFTPQLDLEKWQAFRAHMIATTQINGSYYIQSEIEETCRRCVDRLGILIEIARTQRRPAGHTHEIAETGRTVLS